MKKLFLLAAAATFAFAANAKVWRINYDENANADFRTITAACNSSKVANTDTLYCEAGNHAGDQYDNIISRKGMRVFGPGWGFEPQYGNTSTIADARFANSVMIAADNVTVSGIAGNTLYTGHKDKRNAVLKNICIERCKMKSIQFGDSYLDTIQNYIIRNCYITERILVTTVNAKCVKDVYIYNNIINTSSYHIFQVKGYYDSEKPAFSNINILRNTIIGKSNSGYLITEVWNALVQDNIIICKSNTRNLLNFSDGSNIIRKNVFSLAEGSVDIADIVNNYPDNHYVSATEAGTFTCTQSTYRSEQYFQLKDNSPAKGKAYDGGDCGAFGGSTPYIICGRPQGIPYITDVEVPAQPKDNKLTVTFKVANQNE